jgi:hypothetical protein
MWTVIYIAHNRQIADRIKSRLEEEGLMVQLRAVNLCDEKGRCQVEIAVPKSEANEAHEILSTVLG